MINYEDKLELEAQPIQKRLFAPDLSHIKGHWAEDEIRILYSLQVLLGDEEKFNPSKYVTRAEFAAIMVNALKDIPKPVTTSTSTRTTASRTVTEEKSPFTDVLVDNKYYSEIKKAAEKKIVNGVGSGLYNPDEYITTADAVTIMIRALGLESLAQKPYAVTTFKDNDQIPDYARNPIAVAQRVGLLKGDDKGYLRPREELTNERVAAIVYRLIEYMSKDLIKDYNERVFAYR